MHIVKQNDLQLIKIIYHTFLADTWFGCGIQKLLRLLQFCFSVITDIFYLQTRSKVVNSSKLSRAVTEMCQKF